MKRISCLTVALALLLSARPVTAQEAPPSKRSAGRTKPVPTATVPTGPTKEATVKFIEDYLKGCGEFEGVQAPEGAQYRYILHTPHFRWESIAEVGGRLHLVEWSKTYSFNTSTQRRFSWEAQNSSASVSLSALSPAVEVWQDEEDKLWRVTLSCSTGSCFETNRRYFGEDYSISEARRLSPRRVEEKLVGNSWPVELCGGESEAGRVARAFEHLIELSGGKAPPF